MTIEDERELDLQLADARDEIAKLQSMIKKQNEALEIIHRWTHPKYIQYATVGHIRELIEKTLPQRILKDENV